MNTASEKFQWATNILVLVFLVVNFVYLFKLTTELKDLNAQVATLKQSVEEFKNIALDLGRRAVDKLDKPASELVTRAKEKLRGFNLEEFLKSQNIEVRIKKQEDAPPSKAPPAEPAVRPPPS